MKVAAVIPAYNEELAIGSVVLRTRKYVDKVIVVDDGSKDNTAEIAEMAGAEVIRLGKNHGKAYALKKGIERAKDLGYQVVVTLDGDGQHNPDEIPAVIEPVLKGEADLVIGSRFLNNSNRRIPKYRVLGQKVLNLATNLGSEVKVTDSQSGFRAFNGKILEILTNEFESEGYNIESDMIMYLSGKCRIKEVPISVKYEVPNKHKKNPFAHGVEVLMNILGYVGQKKPLLFFCVPGFVFLLIGILFGFWALLIYSSTGYFPIPHSFGSIVFLNIGALAIIIGLFLNVLVRVMKK